MLLRSVGEGFGAGRLLLFSMLLSEFVFLPESALSALPPSAAGRVFVFAAPLLFVATLGRVELALAFTFAVRLEFAFSLAFLLVFLLRACLFSLLLVFVVSDFFSSSLRAGLPGFHLLWWPG